MSESRVCDLTLHMRARLLCGFYNHRSVPPRWRPLARAYCVTLPIVISIFFFIFTYGHFNWSFGFVLFATPSFFQYYLCILVSLWTGDEYICKFFNQNQLTDVTLDSREIFSRLQKTVKQILSSACAFFVFFMVLPVITLYKDDIIAVGLNILLLYIEQVVFFSCLRNFLIMALFDARLLVLKRRLQRYGFRTVGRRQPQPYCQVYDEIWRGLDETDQPLKLLIFFDIICYSCKIIAGTSFYVFGVPWKNMDYIQTTANIIVYAVTMFQQIVISFGYVAYLESGAGHCDDMAVFTVTQLVKAPTAEERRRMRDFLSVLERRGARYRVLRALPLDARFVLRALSFCTAQIIVMASTIIDSNKRTYFE